MATFSEKMSHKKLVDRIGKLMLKGFPFSERIVLTYKTYFYTGILFDTDKAGVVAGVVPNSSADIAGIRAGDIIKKSSYGDNHIFKESVAKLSEQVNEWVLKHVSVPINKSINNEYKSLTFRVLYCYDIPWCIYKSPFYGTYISSKELIDGGWQVVYTDYIDFIDNFKDIEYKAANPLIFTIKRHDKSVEKIAVVPKKITDEQYHFH
jgi:hypothetical protein